MATSDKIPYMKALLYIAFSDEELSENEIAFFNEAGIEAGLTHEEAESIVRLVVEEKQPIEDIVSEIQTTEIKLALVEKLLSLCYIDGQYTLAEKSGMIDICILLDIQLSDMKKLEKKAETKHKKEIAQLANEKRADEVCVIWNAALDASKKSTAAVGKKIANGSAAFAHSVVSGISTIGSKISMSLESAKKANEENKVLREKLENDTINEAVKQKVILQLHSKIKSLTSHLKEERQRNDRNEEMIRLLQTQLQDLENTMEVAQNAKTA